MRQPVENDARFGIPNERCAGSDSHGWAASRISWRANGPWSSSARYAHARDRRGLKHFLASVTSVVDLNLARERFGHVLE